MKCKEIQELLMTDFIDGELPSDRREAVDKHLGQCSECRLYAEEVRKAAVLPFVGVEDKAVPERVWDSILSAIDEGERASFKRPWFERIGDFLGTILAPFKIKGPALAFASTCIVVIMVLVAVNLPFQPDMGINEIMNENMGFLNSLGTKAATESDMASDNFDTAIEYFFL